MPMTELLQWQNPEKLAQNRKKKQHSLPSDPERVFHEDLPGEFFPASMVLQLVSMS
jgi:hypothetical protein